MNLGDAATEKVYLAEKNVAYVRVAVIALNSLVYLALMDRAGTIPWLAYTIIGVANLYGVGVLAYRPYRRFPVMMTSVFTAVTDGTLITLWILATGSLASPFYVLWYVSIVAVAFRFSYKDTLVISLLYGAAYLGLLSAVGELLVDPVATVVRTSYIFLVASLGGLLSRELLQQTEAKNKMRSLMREARLAEARFRGLLEAAPDAIVIANGQARIVLANRQAEVLFGYERQELLGESIDKFLPQSLAGAVRREADPARERDREAEETLAVEVEGRREDGSTFPCDIRLRPIRTGEGIVVTIIVRDTTERKRAERELEARAAELSRSNAELEQFAYVASHDLQEPLRMVASYVQLLERRYRDELDDDAQTFIGYAVEGATRMQSLINDLLAFSRVGTQGNPLKPTDLGSVLDRVVANLGLRIDDAGATLTHDPMPSVRADEGQIELVVQNLVSNAVKFQGEASPKVHVSAERVGERWVIGVHDNGIGIDPQFHQRIFTIFQRLHTRDDYEGTGIGLAICKKIVERHGGRIWVDSPGSSVPCAAQIPEEEEEEGEAGLRDGPSAAPPDIDVDQLERPWPEGASFYFTLHAVADAREGPEPTMRAVEREAEPDAIARRARELI